MIDAILMGFVCGAFSFLWCNVLTSPGMLGNIVPVAYWRIMGAQKNWKQWIAKPMFDCAVCNSFWTVFVLEIVKPQPNVFVVLVAAIYSAYYLTRIHVHE